MLKRIFLSVLAVTLFMSCTSAPFQKTSEGYPLQGSINVEKLERSILLAMAELNWKPMHRKDNLVQARYSKSNDLIIADIEISYDRDGYAISYIDGKNLDTNLKKMKIHKNYNRWINNLNKKIFQHYMLQED